MELILTAVTLFCMFAATAAKAITTRLIKRQEMKIAEGNRMQAKVEGQLKMAKAQAAVMARNKVALEAKKNTLLKKLDKIESDLESLSQKDTHRQKLNAKRRGGLIKSTRAAPRRTEDQA